jgi:late competence protein required for DNA uptake (superfamily II DNA/RNA helicase)
MGKQMVAKINLASPKEKAKLKGRYSKQLNRLKASGNSTACVEEAVTKTMEKVSAPGISSMVIYGDPQSGKTEMMICLTAKLLDEGHPIVVHLLNDSVDLLTQNLTRFKASGLAPAARLSSELPEDEQLPQELVVLCKKNSKDLQHLIKLLKAKSKIVVIDDEADYATPNSKINQGTKTTINKWVGQLVDGKGHYIGVTATPARLNLNNTFQNDTKRWVKFPSHAKYTGQDVFFPLDAKTVPFRLKLLTQGGTADEAQDAFVRFLVTVAFLNSGDAEEQNYTMLVHTSGKKDDHEADRAAIEKSVEVLTNSESSGFEALVTKIHKAAQELYPGSNPQLLTEYVVENASRATLVVLNSERDRKVAGNSATVPTSPFTVVIGGNIISRGVTFPNLLSMFFTRNVQHKLQQDTYIQRARMFGARGPYLQHFELTIPAQLYGDWQKCFVYHKLSLATIDSNLGVPVWVGDSRVSVASSSSINKASVTLDKGEMSFEKFSFTSSLDTIIKEGPTSVETLKKLQGKIGEGALPNFLIEFIRAAQVAAPGTLAIHQSSSIEGYGNSADKQAIYRKKGFMGDPQLEAAKFPKAVHHLKIFHNGAGKARVFYKVAGGVQFIENPS